MTVGVLLIVVLFAFGVPADAYRIVRRELAWRRLRRAIRDAHRSRLQ